MNPAATAPVTCASFKLPLRHAWSRIPSARARTCFSWIVPVDRRAFEGRSAEGPPVSTYFFPPSDTHGECCLLYCRDSSPVGVGRECSPSCRRTNVDDMDLPCQLARRSHRSAHASPSLLRGMAFEHCAPRTFSRDGSSPCLALLGSNVRWTFYDTATSARIDRRGQHAGSFSELATVC